MTLRELLGAITAAAASPAPSDAAAALSVLGAMEHDVLSGVGTAEEERAEDAIDDAFLTLERAWGVDALPYREHHGDLLAFLRRTKAPIPIPVPL
jgi:hypothetical protein